MEYFGLTDKGRVRPTNQDIFQIEAREDNQTALLVVCDGNTNIYDTRTNQKQSYESRCKVKGNIVVLY